MLDYRRRPDGPHPSPRYPRGHRSQHQGVKLINLDKDDRLQAIAPVISEESQDAAAPEIQVDRGE
jgi:hypothetical protein